MLRILSKLEKIITIQQTMLAHLLNEQPQVMALNDEWLDNADVKQILKISSSTLYRLRQNNRLPAKKMGGKWYYPKSVLNQL